MAFLKKILKFIWEAFGTTRTSHIVAVDGQTCFIKTADGQIGCLTADDCNILPIGLNVSALFYGCKTVQSYVYSDNGGIEAELLYQDEGRWLVKVLNHKMAFYGFLYNGPEEKFYVGKKIHAQPFDYDPLSTWQML